MRRLFYYSIILLSLITVVLFYFLKTASGHRNMGYFIEDYLSIQTYNKIRVLSFNLENYPNILLNLQINDRANISLQGEISNYDINMTYHLKGNSFTFNDVYLKDKIDVHGTLFGAFSSLRVTGEGTLFDGDIKYSFMNVPHSIRDMNIEMKRVAFSKIFSFLDEEAYLKGSADIDAKFKLFSKYEKEGKAKIYMQRASIPKLANNTYFVLNSTIDFEQVEYRYGIDMHSDIGTITLRDGVYHEGTKIAKGAYEIHLKNLLFLKERYPHDYKGGLDTNGTVGYDGNRAFFSVRGESQQFGGDLSYLYKKNSIELKLKNLSLERLLQSFSYPLLFSSNIYGIIKLNLKEKMMIVNTTLKKTRFKKSRFSDVLYRKLNINILDATYDKSYFSGGYQNNILSTTLKIDNGKDYIYLTDSKIDVLNNSIYSKFEMKIAGEEIFGKINGTLREPKVWIDKNRYIIYQTDKHLGNWFRTK